MKKLILMVTLVTSVASFNANALQAIAGTYIVGTIAGLSLGVSSTIYGPDCVLGQAHCKEAVQILADSQEYMQSGEMSALLAEKVKQVQADNKMASEEDAVDALNQVSLELLK